MEPFWLVWVADNMDVPMHKHDSFLSAQKEAERLLQQPRTALKTIYILQAVAAGQIRQSPVQWTALGLETIMESA